MCIANRLKLLSYLLILSILSACRGGNLPNPSTVTQPGRRTVTFAWIPKALDNPVFEVGRAGAVARAIELSASGPVQVEVLYVGSVASDAAEQVRVVEDVIARGVDGIAISCNDPTACIEPIKCRSRGGGVSDFSNYII